jgi:acylphosphatase
MKTLRIRVTGIVQGVFFRAFVKENADKLNVRGFVRNLDSGRTEIVAEGRDESVNQLLKSIRQGPAHAEVKNVEIEELKHQGFKEFKIMRI